MVTIANLVTEYRGLSSDSKPTDAGNGSAFIEMDTGKLYFFNEDSNEWVEFQSGSSDDGGGGSITA